MPHVCNRVMKSTVRLTFDTFHLYQGLQKETLFSSCPENYIPPAFQIRFCALLSFWYLCILHFIGTKLILCVVCHIANSTFKRQGPFNVVSEQSALVHITHGFPGNIWM